MTWERLQLRARAIRQGFCSSGLGFFAFCDIEASGLVLPGRNNVRDKPRFRQHKHPARVCDPGLGLAFRSGKIKPES